MTRRQLVLITAALIACDKGTSPPSVSRVDVSPGTAQLQIGQQTTVQLTATAKDKAGNALANRTVTWRSSNDAVATVSAGGFVNAVSAGSTTIRATVDGVEGRASVQVLPAAVAEIVVSLGASIIGVGETTAASASTRDASGNVLNGHLIAWSSSNPSIVTVSTAGLVSAVGPGTATITATSEGISGGAPVRVVSTRPNLALENLYAVQSVQRDDGGVPLVAGGLPVLVNVFGTLDRPFPAGTPSPKIRITVLNGATPLMVHEGAVTASVTPFASPENPIYQLLLPSSMAVVGLRLLAEINFDASLTEETLTDNKWPASGVARTIDVRDVPPLPLHFVPIMLTNGGSVGNVAPSTMLEYQYATRQLHPVSSIAATTGPVFTSDVNFGTGQQPEWLTILQQLDALRVIEGSSDYYVGVLRPPPSTSFVQYGGFSYIPSNPESVGPSTRTSVLVGVGWFNRARQTTELVAHETAHAMGRRHAPCGGAAGPDPSYPYPGGAIGAHGFDLYTYSLGGSSFPTSYVTTASDIMSYCTPVWISDYNYDALLRARVPPEPTVAGGSPGAGCECLVVWGAVTGDSVTLRPAFVTRAHVALPGARGAYRLEGLGARGERLFGYDFEPAEIDHAPNVRHFTFAIPLTEADRGALSRLRVTRGSRSTELRAPGAAGSAPILRGGPSVARLGPGEVEIRWDSSRYPAIVVRDQATDRVLAIATKGRVTVRTPNGVDVVASDGVRSVEHAFRLPR